ncbi:MAG: bis-aminopropyl spermidine synthase family protein [Oligoflexales bacterium]
MNQRLPSWEELCYFGAASKLSSEERYEVEKLRNTPPRYIKLARMLLSWSAQDPSIRKFINLSWGEVVDVVHEQAAQHLFLNLPEDGRQPVRPFTNRTHAQQPCTKKTTLSRCEEAERLCGFHKPVLLLGDDDMVGLTMARKGFTDITCVDIDPELCRDIEEQAKRENLSLKVLCHDISTNPPEQFIKNYAMVFIDPIYSVFGLELFLGAAKRFTNVPHECFYFLSIHLMSLFKHGLQQAEELLAREDIDVIKRYPAFNTYPAPKGPARAIMLFNRACMKTTLMRKGNHVEYFASDGFLLKPRA